VILCARSAIPIDGQMGEEGTHLTLAHVAGMALVVKQDEAFGPVRML